MSEIEFPTTILWLTGLALPWLFFFLGDCMARRRWLFLRALGGVAAGWAFTIAYVQSAQALIIANSTPERVLELYEIDGAPRAFATVMGWLLPMAEVAVAWLLLIAWRGWRYGSRESLAENT